jgi:hypothetical protein
MLFYRITGKPEVMPGQKSGLRKSAQTSRTPFLDRETKRRWARDYCRIALIGEVNAFFAENIGCRREWILNIAFGCWNGKPPCRLCEISLNPRGLISCPKATPNRPPSEGIGSVMPATMTERRKVFFSYAFAFTEDLRPSGMGC